jgi:hypothetical protein
MVAGMGSTKVIDVLYLLCSFMDTLCVAMELATFMASRKQLHATETALVLNPPLLSF